MRFIDLFAGLGGFNVALTHLGHTCVFASEIDGGLRALYAKNFGLRPEGDIRTVDVEDVPPHDILCAGFPCQPFSKAGEQQGFDHPKWGDLFEHVLRIVRHHLPAYIMLENVPNLEWHDSGRTWEKIRAELESLGYYVLKHRLSPHHYGIPQIRERLFIVCSREPLVRFEWPTPRRTQLSIEKVLEADPPDAHALSAQVFKCLDVWQEFISRFPRTCELPSFPIWSMEFGATYPYNGPPPSQLSPGYLRQYSGSHGVSLANLSDDEVMNALPSYARKPNEAFPGWKRQFIRQNRDLYLENKDWIDEWVPLILQFPPSLQKLEWNCKGEERDIWKYVIQFRASGVRVKRPTTAPSLIAMTTTQVPIIAWERRYMTPRECARLQSLEGIQLPSTPTAAFKALGNAVNARLARMIASSLLDGQVSDEDAAELSAPEPRTLWSLATA